jgi:hypothetical protein
MDMARQVIGTKFPGIMVLLLLVYKKLVLSGVGLPRGACFPATTRPLLNAPGKLVHSRRAVNTIC